MKGFSVKSLTLQTIKVCLFATLVISILGLQISQIDGEDKQSLLAFKDSSLSWGMGQSGSNQEDITLYSLYPFLIKRTIRTSYLNLRSVSQARYAFPLTKTVVMSSTNPNFFCQELTHFYPVLIDLGIRTRKIPTPKNTDEPPPLHFA
jgi:hypothetical protein